MKMYKTFEVYFLGITTNSTKPPFSTANRLPDYVAEIEVGENLVPNTSNVELVSSWSGGVPTFTTDGNSFIQAYPPSVMKLVGFKPYYPLFENATACSTAIDKFFTVSYNLQNYISLPSSTTNFLWLAFASADKYVAFCLKYDTSRGTYISDQHMWYIATWANFGLYSRANDTRITGSYDIFKTIPFVEQIGTKASVFTIYAHVLRYVNSRYMNFLYDIGDPHNDRGYNKKAVVYHSNTSFITNQDCINFLDSLPTTFSDPYEDAPRSGEDVGGGGTYDTTSDTILPPSVPSTNVSNSGFVRIYNPTLAELQNLANYMWTDTTFLQTVINHAKQLLENPIESVISLNILPCPIPTTTAQSVKVLFINTGVTMKPASTQFVEVDCGTFDLKEHYGSALDYSPYTKIHCYLPYIGEVMLNTDEVMNKTLSIKYRIDIVTGMCVALIAANGIVLYQFSGHCAISMPITSADFSNYIAAAIQAAKVVGGAVAGAAGAAGPAAALLGTSAPRGSTTTTKFTTRNPSTGRQQTAGTIATYREASGASFGEMAVHATSNTVSAVMGAKLIVEHAGGFTGNSGYLAVRRPFLILEIPDLCYPENYGKYNGFPSMMTLNLGACVGYTKVQEIHLTGFSATNPEMSEIAELLKGGVVF